MPQKRIAVVFSGSQNKVNQYATGLVRFQNKLSRSCFHVELLETGDVEIFVADHAIEIMDLENAVITPKADAAPEFHEALSSNSDMSKTEKALAIVKEFPYRTSQEMASKVNPSIISADTLHKRLSDLAKKNLVRKVETRGCTITGKLASTWAPVEA